MFAGVLCGHDTTSPDDLVSSSELVAALCPDHPAGATGSWCEGPFLLAQAVSHRRLRGNGNGQAVTVPQRCAESGRVIAFWGRLDNADALARDLGLSGRFSTDEQLVLAAYARWGTSCPERLVGDYACAICDPRARRVLLFRDRLGVKPLYYRLDGRFLFFATTAAAFPRLRRHAPSPDPDWIARALAGAGHDRTATGWTEVVKLAPGHWLEVGADSVRLEPYHSWRDDPPWTTRRDPQHVEAYRCVLEEAIRSRAPLAEPMGSESSGGLDSSTITAYLAHFLGVPGDQLCALGFATQEKEPEYIIATSVHSGISHNYLATAYPSTEDSCIARGLAAVGYPEEQGSAIAHIPFYEECQRRGIRTLFSGFGGDETVTNSGRLLGRELLDHREYSAFWRHLPGRPIARPLRLARVMAQGSDWGGGHPRLAAAMEARWPYQLVRSDIVERLGLLETYRQQAAFDGPYRRINDFILGNRLSPNLTTRLETCTLVAASYGVEYRWPLLDSGLIQQYLSTPSIEKADRSFGRYLHRRAVEGVVAPKVAWKPDKDMGGRADSNGRGTDSVRQKDQAEMALRQVARLHPALEDLIDVESFRRQIEAAAAGALNTEAGFQFFRNTSRITWLNHWLSGGPTA
jgi:asparagine synthase (glutamine-hydrolysing)